MGNVFAVFPIITMLQSVSEKKDNFVVESQNLFGFIHDIRMLRANATHSQIK